MQQLPDKCAESQSFMVKYLLRRLLCNTPLKATNVLLVQLVFYMVKHL